MSNNNSFVHLTLEQLQVLHEHIVAAPGRPIGQHLQLFDITINPPQPSEPVIPATKAQSKQPKPPKQPVGFYRDAMLRHKKNLKGNHKVVCIGAQAKKRIGLDGKSGRQYIIMVEGKEGLRWIQWNRIRKFGFQEAVERWCASQPKMSQELKEATSYRATTCCRAAASSKLSSQAPSPSHANNTQRLDNNVPQQVSQGVYNQAPDIEGVHNHQQSIAGDHPTSPNYHRHNTHNNALQPLGSHQQSVNGNPSPTVNNHQQSTHNLHSASAKNHQQTPMIIYQIPSTANHKAPMIILQHRSISIIKVFLVNTQHGNMIIGQIPMVSRRDLPAVMRQVTVLASQYQATTISKAPGSHQDQPRFINLED